MGTKKKGFPMTIQAHFRAVVQHSFVWNTIACISRAHGENNEYIFIRLMHEAFKWRTVALMVCATPHHSDEYVFVKFSFDSFNRSVVSKDLHVYSHCATLISVIVPIKKLSASN